MISKLIHIKHLGRFTNAITEGAVKLKKFTLVFGENGLGKSTLCDILRSLQTGEPEMLLGRATLGATSTPEIGLLVDNERRITFTCSQWTANLPDLAIFDAAFVARNVYSGDSVDLEHRRSLYGLVIGSEGVTYARRISDLDAASRSKSADIRTQEQSLSAQLLLGMSLDRFLSLQDVADVDAMIAAHEQRVAAAEEAEAIKTAPALIEVSVPAVPTDFVPLLERGIEHVSREAESATKRHIQHHGMRTKGMNWLSEGLRFIVDNTCPFCGQDLERSLSLVQSFRAYFSDEYNTLKADIATMESLLSASLGDKVAASVDLAVERNKTSLSFWGRFVSVQLPTISNISAVIARSAVSCSLLLSQKRSNPLDSIRPTDEFYLSSSLLSTIQTQLELYNSTVRQANVLIEKQRMEAAGLNVATAKQELALLKATKQRYQPEMQAACEKVLSARSDKTELERQKAEAKSRLDEYSAEVMSRFERHINDYLEDFQAGFRITKSNHSYAGGVPSTSYKITINDTEVTIGDRKSPLSSPSFKNTLSSGDKNSLALAFFLSQLRMDPGKQQRIVIFDDPFSSFDSFRREWTIRHILNIGCECRQVIVLSHDLQFLYKLWTKLNMSKDERQGLKLRVAGEGTTVIGEFNIEEAIQGVNQENLAVLSEYLSSGKGSANDMIKRIRPVLETHLRSVSASVFAPGDTLGTMIGKIRGLDPTHSLYPLVTTLDALNDYTKQFHHGDNQSSPNPTIDEQELRGFVKKTLTIVGRL